MPRAIWSGAITFGLLNVPVKLYSAVSKQTIRFRELRESDGSRVRHKRVAEADEQEVAYDDIVKGYEISPDRYVMFDRKELSELDPKKSKAIEIEDFVELDQIDPIYFDHPYYLAPATGASKAYALLVQAMEQEGKVAIARFVLRSRENLAALRATDGVLTLATMRFHDEVVDPDGLDELLPDEDIEPSGKELKMARQLIGSFTTDFTPESYTDDYREALLDLIERKASGEEVVVQPASDPEPTAAPDLMAALEESLAAVKRSRDGDNAGTDTRSSKDSAKAKPKQGPKGKAGADAKDSAKKPAKT
ncbi:MAG: Ku protein [Solirubrobacterales bacterium]